MKKPSFQKTKKLALKQLGQYRPLSQLSDQEWLAKSLDNPSTPPVGLKLLTDPQAEPPTPALLHNFEHLTGILGRLDHPLTWPVIDAGREGNCLYLVSPYRADAVTLQKRLEQISFTQTQTISLVNDILEGLDFAHRRGMMHGSLGPDNLLLFPAGPVALRNFGLVKFEYDNPGLTGGGLTPTNPAYMAPEQFIGCGDYRSDLYAVGVLLFRLLSDELPFKAETTLEFGRQHLNAPLPLPHPRIPVAFQAFLAQALHKSPEQRFATADHMATAFDKAVRGLSNPVDEVAARPQLQSERLSNDFAYSSPNSTEFIRM